MKKIVCLTIFLLLASAGAAPHVACATSCGGDFWPGFLLFLQSGVSGQLANQDKTGLYVNSIERMMRLDEDDIDLATAALLLSRQAGAEINHKRYRRKIDDMALVILNRLQQAGRDAGRDFFQPRQEPQVDHRAISTINKYVFKELGFSSSKTADDAKDLFLHYVLDRKKGYCLSLSILYLSIGERLGLPLYGVVVPGHFFVRYDDGKVSFNIETTSNGNSAPDEHYLTKFNVPADVKGSIYMKNLTKKQTLSCFFNNLSNVYQSFGDIESALILLERAVEMTPELAMVHTNLGNLYLKKGRTQDAVNQYRAALEIYPDDPKTHNNLGNAYFTIAQGQDGALDGSELEWLDAAIDEYKLSLSLAEGRSAERRMVSSADADSTDTYKNLARAYSKRGFFEDAIIQLTRALEIDPKDSKAYIQLGDVYRDMGDSNQAIAHYHNALLLESDSPEAYFGLGLTYHTLGLLDDEIRAYRRVLTIMQSRPGRKTDLEHNRQITLSALQNLGNAYIEKQRYDAAIEQYKKAVLLDPDDAVLHYNLAVVYVKRQDYASAAAEYSAALKLNPDLASAHNGLAVCYYFLEKYDLAWEHINTASQLGFEIPQDLYRILSKKHNQ